MDQPWQFGAPSSDVYPPPGMPPFSRYGFPGDDPRRHHSHPYLPPPHLPFGYPDPRTTTQLAPPPALLHRERLVSFLPPWQQPPVHDEALESGGFLKRVRVGDVAAPADPSPGGGVSAEDKRRLNLIRNHGQQWPGDGVEAGADVHLSGYHRPDVGNFQHDDSRRRLNIEAEFVNVRKRPFSELEFSELGLQFLSGGLGYRDNAMASHPPELDRFYSHESSEVGHKEWRRRNNDNNGFPDIEHRRAIPGRPDFPVKSSSSQRYQSKEEISENENHRQHGDEGYTQIYYSGKQNMNGLHQKIPYGNHNVQEDQRKQIHADNSPSPPVRSYFSADYHIDAPSTSTSMAEGFGPRDFGYSHLSKYKFNDPYSNEFHRHAEPLNNATVEIDSLKYLGSRQGIETRRPVTDAVHANQSYPPLPLQPFPSPPPEPSLSHFRDSAVMMGPMVLRHSNPTDPSPPGPPSEANLEGQSSSRTLLQDGPFSHLSAGFESKTYKTNRLHFEEVNPVQAKHFQEPKLTIVDASHLFKMPYRNTRPDHIVIILRGLPGIFFDTDYEK